MVEDIYSTYNQQRNIIGIYKEYKLSKKQTTQQESRLRYEQASLRNLHSQRAYEKCVDTFAVRLMKNKTLLKYYFIPIRLAKN